MDKNLGDKSLVLSNIKKKQSDLIEKRVFLKRPTVEVRRHYGAT